MISEQKLRKEIEELNFEKGDLQIQLDKVFNPTSPQYKKNSRMSDEKFSKVTSRIDEILAIVKFCKEVILEDD